MSEEPTELIPAQNDHLLHIFLALRSFHIAQQLHKMIAASSSFKAELSTMSIAQDSGWNVDSFRIVRGGINFLITLHQKERTLGGIGMFQSFFQHGFIDKLEPVAR